MNFDLGYGFRARVSFSRPENNKTSCWITVYDDRFGTKEEAKETVSCYYKDEFNAELGRKYAFAKALQSLYPGKKRKEDRKYFYERYFAAKVIGQLHEALILLQSANKMGV